MYVCMYHCNEFYKQYIKSNVYIYIKFASLGYPNFSRQGSSSGRSLEWTVGDPRAGGTGRFSSCGAGCSG